MQLSTKKEDFKKALNIVSLGVEDKEGSPQSHAIFRINDEMKISSTNGDRIATAICPIQQVSKTDTVFTADPKKLADLVDKSGSEIIKLDYNSEDKTLKVFVSENENSYVSFASFEPDKLITFDTDLKKLQPLKTMNAALFLTGLKFIRGFLADPKNRKFSCMFVANGIMYGANGSNRVGAFKNTDLDGIEPLAFRQISLVPIITMINRLDPLNLQIMTTSKIIALFTTDNSMGFGFLKTNEEMPSFPIELSAPKTDNFTITDRTLFSTKLSRLAIAAGNSVGIKMSLSNTGLELSTIAERSSTEHMACKRNSGNETKDFIVDYRHFKLVMGLLQTDGVDVYVDERRCHIFSDGELEIKEKEKTSKKSYRSVAVFSLARQV